MKQESDFNIKKNILVRVNVDKRTWNPCAVKRMSAPASSCTSSQGCRSSSWMISVTVHPRCPNRIQSSSISCRNGRCIGVTNIAAGERERGDTFRYKIRERGGASVPVLGTLFRDE